MESMRRTEKGRKEMIGYILLVVLAVLVIYVVFRFFITGEKWVDSAMLSERNRRGTATRVGLWIIGGLILAFAAGLFLPSTAIASTGNVARDGCHKNKVDGGRHWHLPSYMAGGKKRVMAGQCIRINGKVHHTVTISAAPISMERKARARRSKSLPTLQAYTLCMKAIGGFSTNARHNWCRSIPSSKMKDFLACFKIQTGFSISAGVKNCKSLLRIK